MTRFEHANLVVHDISKTLEFIQTAFPTWYIRNEGTTVWEGKTRNWLHIGDEDYYLTLNDGAIGDNRDLTGHSAGLAHLGFVVDDVDPVIARLKEKGYEIHTRIGGHPFRENVYYIEPSGFEFEFVQYHSNQPEEKNRYDASGQITLKETNRTIPEMNEKTFDKASFVSKLYQAVDQRDLNGLGAFLAPDVDFKFGNLEAVNGKENVLEANKGFFQSIKDMSHDIDNVWGEGTEIICNGTVNYKRLDGTPFSAVFATVLTVQDGLIQDYRIYADVSGLYN